MKATFGLTEDYRQQCLVEQGERLPETQTLDIPLGDISPQARQALVLADPKLAETVRLALPDPYRAKSLSYPPMKSSLWQAPLLPTASASDWERLLNSYARDYRWREEENLAILQTEFVSYVEDLQAALASEGPRTSFFYAEGKFSSLPGYAEAQHLAEQLKQRASAQARASEEAKAANEFQAEENRKQRAEDKRVWIEQQGSLRLRKLFGAGYDCQRLYVSERALLEHPDYQLDFDGKADWKERSCPSDDAFAEAQRVGGRVVWLTEPVPPDTGDEDEDWVAEPFRECEAVVIREYLGKYDLVKALG